MFVFFDYVFYRITDSRYYQFVDPNDTWIWGWGVLSTCESINVCSAIMFLFSIVNRIVSSPVIVVLSIFIPIFIANLFRYNGKKYKILKEKHSNDSNRIIKGIGVLCYVIGSMMLFALACIVQGLVFKNVNR